MTLDFEALVGPHLKEMYRLALAIVGPDDAADVTQDALVAAWRGVGGLRDEARARFWLHRIVVNRARDVIRARSRRPRWIRVVDPEAVAGASRPDSSAEVGERDRLDRAFETLTPDQRAILALHYTLDLSIPQVAAALSIREGTAKSRVHSAIERLRAAMPDEVSP